MPAPHSSPAVQKHCDWQNLPNDAPYSKNLLAIILIANAAYRTSAKGLFDHKKGCRQDLISSAAMVKGNAFQTAMVKHVPALLAYVMPESAGCAYSTCIDSY
ncbi:hypothetical protein [Polaromonas naphthalenivorans]|nr:hypothetical protein [Polaromonas naphthalenivorans]